jgi:hypothetical protein
MKRTVAWIGVLLCGWALAAAEPKATGAQSVSPERAVIESIVDQGMNHSEVPETAEYLFDQIGGRLTNSPGMRRAERWTQDKLKGWGLRDVRAEGFDIDNGSGKLRGIYAEGNLNAAPILREWPAPLAEPFAYPEPESIR